MQLKLTGKYIFETLINKIQNYIEFTGFTKEDGLPYWRAKIFNGLLLILVAFGSIAIIPNLIASIIAETHIITITDFSIYSILVFLFVRKSISVKIKTTITLILVYILSIVLLVMLGPMGPGFIWLASGSLIAALLLGLRASIITIILNFIIIVFLAFAIRFQVFDTIFFKTYTIVTWIAISLNVIIFNAITSIPLALLINALEKTLINEKELKIKLIEKNKLTENDKIKAQESDKLKSAFLANLSHEIRTPMNAIVGFSELIQNEIEVDSRISKFSKLVSQNADYLLHLINDIVDISLIESDHIRYVNSSFKLGNLIDQLKPIIQESTAQKRHPETITKFVFTPEVYNLSITTDATRLKQILINLISNALKYTPSGFVRIQISARGKNIQFNVVDSGVGIPIQEQEKIYQRFSKIEREGKFSMPGIGLGLSISKGLVEGMGGRIWFESKENEGTSFNFTLPVINRQEFQE